MAYTAELCGCVEDERWEGLPVCRPPLEKIGGGGTLFTEGGHYSPVNFVLGGHYSPVNYVRGDILWGDSVHYDTGTP